jgi:hypothetical protein
MYLLFVFCAGSLPVSPGGRDGSGSERVYVTGTWMRSPALIPEKLPKL